MNAWHIFVFSFNRGIFLKNCLDSINECSLNIDVTVIDDNSDDPLTQDILNRVESEYDFDLVKAEEKTILEKRLGGLYGNMNRALEICKLKNKKYMLFIQDDMQFVRKMNTVDLSNVEEIFDTHEDIQQIQSCFLKNLQIEHYRDHLAPLVEGKCFVSSNSANDLSAFSDVGIFYVPRFEQKNGLFVSGERQNNKVTLQHSLRLAHLAQPFMMWLPYATSYHGKKVNLKNKIIETVAQCGFYPIDIMDDSTYQAMQSNPENKLPIAEFWLKVDGLRNYSTWCFSAGVINLFARGGVRKKIAQLLWKI